ncbi:MAG: zinc-ribbon domain-containing protein, partial [Clostridia bacterium]|nr:zinc-ribbon domain-containing protein [Clostridia bacterium]
MSDDPRILAEWDAEKNAPRGLFPDRITQGSTQKAWWKCAIGHEWEARIDHRFVMHANCPYCSGKRPVIGENDLKTRFP